MLHKLFDNSLLSCGRSIYFKSFKATDWTGAINQSLLQQANISMKAYLPMWNKSCEFTFKLYLLTVTADWADHSLA